MSDSDDGGYSSQSDTDNPQTLNPLDLATSASASSSTQNQAGQPTKAKGKGRGGQGGAGGKADDKEVRKRSSKACMFLTRSPPRHLRLFTGSGAPRSMSRELATLTAQLVPSHSHRRQVRVLPLTARCRSSSLVPRPHPESLAKHSSLLTFAVPFLYLLHLPSYLLRLLLTPSSTLLFAIPPLLPPLPHLLPFPPSHLHDCNSCRKSKCKCTRILDPATNEPVGPCQNCLTVGAECTFLGASRKRCVACSSLEDTGNRCVEVKGLT